MKVILANGTLARLSNGTVVSINNRVVSKEIDSIENAIKEDRAYIELMDLGSSTYTGGQIYDKNKAIAEVSYNGKVWDLNGNPYKVKGE